MNIMNRYTPDPTTNIELAVITMKSLVICLVFCNISLIGLELAVIFLEIFKEKTKLEFRK